MRLLVTDELSEEGLKMLRSESSVDVDVRPGMSHEELVKTIVDYDGVIIRSGTRITADVIDAGRKLSVIGRAGVGVDNVDVAHATRRGILVMNTPSANIISAAEHSLAMMLTLARNIVWAHASVQAGKWERKKFTGVEMSGKTLGIVGVGRVGAEVARRAKSFNMDLIGYDPFISEELAEKLQVKLMSLEEVLAGADIITIHAPLTKSTHHMIGEDQFKLMRPTALLVNCARGGIVDEEALYEALTGGKIAGAAFDVFEEEPIANSKLIGLPNLVTTPHLGASTREAQEKVSLEMAECVVKFLKENIISNAINAPRGKFDPKLAPYVQVAEMVGSFALQIMDGPIEKVQVTAYGELAGLNTKMLTISALIGVISNIIGESTNIINAESLAKEKGIQVIETNVAECKHYLNMVSVKLYSGDMRREVRGTVFPSGQARIVGVDHFDLEVPLEGDFIMTQYNDVPGIIGKVGNILASKGINIAQMGVGRESPGGNAIMLISVDEVVRDDVLTELKSQANFHEAKFIKLTDIQPKAYMD
jgi:D-3-phosphoglycerate dehydrogenase